MAKIKQAMYWLRKGKKVCRPVWEKGSYWVLGSAEMIMWNNEKAANVHLKQLEATDFELFKEPHRMEEFTTVRDLMKGLIDCDPNRKIEVRNIRNQRIPATKIMAVKPDGLVCLFG